MRFAIRRPAGGRSKYVFATPTAQIAIRGTVGYVVSGPRGVQRFCVECARGDVTLTAGIETYTLESGQMLNDEIRGNAQTVTIVANTTIDNPAIDQFLNGVNPFGRPAAEGFDVTGSDSVS